MPNNRKRIVKKRLGELLLEKGYISKQQLEKALRIQSEEDSGKLLGEIFVDLGYVSEEEVMICLTAQYGVPYLPIESYEINQDIVKSIPTELMKKYNFLPVDRIGGVITIISSDIFDESVLQEIEDSIGANVESFITTPTALAQAMEKYIK